MRLNYPNPSYIHEERAFDVGQSLAGELGLALKGRCHLSDYEADES